MNRTTVSSRRGRVTQIRRRTSSTCFELRQRSRILRRLCLLFIVSLASMWSFWQIDSSITQCAMASTNVEPLDESHPKNNSNGNSKLLGVHDGVAAAAASPAVPLSRESLIRQGLTIEFAGMSKEEIESLYSVDERDPPTPEGDLAEDPLFEHYLREKIEEIWGSAHSGEERSKAGVNGGMSRGAQTNEHSSSRDVSNKNGGGGAKRFSGLRRLEEARCPPDGGMCDLIFEHYAELI